MGHRSASTRSLVGRPRSRTVVASLAMATGALVFTGGVASATGSHGKGGGSANGGGEHKVTLCHATGSRSNPYVKITVDHHAVIKSGHGDHDGPVFSPSLAKGVKWGDIIPAFDLGAKGSYPGKNMTTDGRALLNAGCDVPAAPTTTRAPSPTTSTTGAVGGSTTSTTSGSTTSTTGAVAGSTTSSVAGGPTSSTTGAVAGTTLLPSGNPGATSTSTTAAVAGTTIVASAGGGSLPVTGTSVGLATVGLLLVVGGGAALVARRKGSLPIG